MHFSFYIFSATGNIQPVVEIDKLPKRTAAKPPARKQTKKMKKDDGIKKYPLPAAVKKPSPRAKKEPPKPKKVSPAAAKKVAPVKKSVTPPENQNPKTRSQRKAQQKELEEIGRGKNETEEEASGSDFIIDESSVIPVDDDNDKVVTIMSLIEIQNEVLQEMKALPEDVRSQYYFEESFAAKLHNYFGVTDKYLVKMYTRQVNYKVGDKIKVAAVTKTPSDTSSDTVIMVKKTGNDGSKTDDKVDDRVEKTAADSTKGADGGVTEEQNEGGKSDIHVENEQTLKDGENESTTTVVEGKKKEEEENNGTGEKNDNEGETDLNQVVNEDVATGEEPKKTQAQVIDDKAKKEVTATDDKETMDPDGKSDGQKRGRE